MDTVGCSFGGRSVGGKAQRHRGRRSLRQGVYRSLLADVLGSEGGRMPLLAGLEGISHYDHVVEDVSTKSLEFRIAMWEI